LYGYFSHNANMHLECIELVEIVENKGNKILWNIKIRWIFMINFVKRLLFEYCTLLMKMALDKPFYQI